MKITTISNTNTIFEIIKLMTAVTILLTWKIVFVLDTIVISVTEVEQHRDVRVENLEVFKKRFPANWLKGL